MSTPTTSWFLLLSTFYLLFFVSSCKGCSALVKDLFVWKDVEGPAKSVTLMGYLRCNGQPYIDAKLKLYDHDAYSFDDEMGETAYPDQYGHFYIKGTGYEKNLNPRLYIYHNCGSLTKWCYYKTYLKIPQSMLVEGEEVPKEKISHLNYIELNNEQSHIDCIN